MECNTSHPATKCERLLTGAHVCEQTIHAPRSPKGKSDISLKSLSLSRRKVQNLHYLGVNSLITSKQGTEVDRGSYVAKLFLFWPHLSTHSLAFCNQNIRKHRRGGWWLFPFPGQRPVLSDSTPSSVDTPHSFSCSGFLLFLLFLLIEFFLPPGEEGSPALETLCVGLAVGSLRCSGCFDDYRGHLDQLQGCFTVLQGLAQVQDLGRKKSMLKKKSLPCQAAEIEVAELTCPLITATCLWNCPLSKPGSFCETQ